MDFMNRIRARAEERRRGSYLPARIGKSWCFAQDDLVVANAAGATVRAKINTGLQALGNLMDGAAAPSVTYKNLLWADRTTNTLKRRNAANTGWIKLFTLDESFLLSRSANTILGESDFGKTISATGTYTQTFAAAATLADGWWLQYRNDNAAGGGVITLDPNGAETIDGALTIALNPGESCVIECNASAFKTIGRASSYIGMPRAHLAGLTLSNNGTITKLDVAAGKCRDATDAADIVLTAAITAGAIASPWAAGNTANKLDTGASANSTWYHVWAIRKDTDGTGDWLFSLSASAPTMPSGYTFKRRLGSVRTDVSGNITAFVQDGDYFRWAASVLDVNTTNPGNAAISSTLTVPTGVNVQALFNGYVSITATGSRIIFSDLAANAEAPAIAAAPLSQLAAELANNTQTGQFQIRTNTAAQIRYQMGGGDANTIVRVATTGWLDSRGRNS